MATFFLTAVLLPSDSLAGTEVSISTQGGKVLLSTSAASQRIKQELERQMLAIGYLLRSAQEGILVYEGDADSATNFMWTNSYTGEKPKFRFRVNIVDLSDSRRVVLAKVVFIPGTKLRPEHEEDRARTTDLEEAESLLRKVAAGLDQH
ncbi:hypothetical protein [Ideonella sp.]|uniref:hypothetical protein n=1 Tax=Ideonella sp. TaxID=1929293 RepID=UPI002B4A0701|nr:hypothetical protein [Ideonella sp.]HJV72467.1 hypothetical protein [Ideonella sp.]